MMPATQRYIRVGGAEIPPFGNNNVNSNNNSRLPPNAADKPIPPVREQVHIIRSSPQHSRPSSRAPSLETPPSLHLPPSAPAQPPTHLQTTRLYVTPTGSYTLRTQLSQAFMAIALLIANVSQLKNFLEVHPNNHPFFYHVLMLLACSIGIQIAGAVFLLVAYWARSKLELLDLPNKKLSRTSKGCMSFADCLENLYMIFTFLIMAVNVFIALFIANGQHLSQSSAWISANNKQTTPASYVEETTAESLALTSALDIANTTNSTEFSL